MPTSLHGRTHVRKPFPDIRGRLTLMIAIDDPADQRVDDFRNLRGRESTEVLWAEGPTVVARLLTSTLRTRSLLLTPPALARMSGLIDPTTLVFVAEQAVVNRIVDFDLHRGAIAVAERPAALPLDIALNGATRVLVLEGINDPTNLGAIARSARALGADALLIDPTCADPYYRRSVRVSMGELLHLRVARVPLTETFSTLGSTGFTIWALTPRHDATPIGEALRGGPPERLALVLGAEGPGLSGAVLGGFRNVRIPQRLEVDSLNVGHAAAAALAIVASSMP
jgi:tRNA G18 (ribose-2'-O)-methylase SpoU